ncbi:MAG: alpha/beta hydrolase [Ilumatobacteraceae bacterium]
MAPPGPRRGGRDGSARRRWRCPSPASSWSSAMPAPPRRRCARRWPAWFPACGSSRVRWRSLVRPFHNSAAGIEIERDVAYGPDKRQRVDIYRPAGSPEGRPVLLYIHGGGWVSGDKRTQALTLLHEAARRGYVVVSANYRLAPRNKYPLWVQDVKAALVWVRATIAQYGGNPQWVAVAGGSAGGHLAAVLATTPNEPSLQPGAEDVDTRVAACVPLYGAFDFTDRWGIRGKTSMVGFLEKMVMSSKLAADRPTWELISPAHRGGPDTPPFFVVHGAIDVLLYREETRAFVDYLRGTGAPTVLYAELPHAQHAFDMIKSVRTFATVDAILGLLGPRPRHPGATRRLTARRGGSAGG